MRYSGQPVKRLEDAKLITGDGLFINDIKLPDMLHAFVIRSVHAHATSRGSTLLPPAQPNDKRSEQ